MSYLVAEELPGNTLMENRLRLMAMRVKDLAPVFTAITAAFRSKMRKRFATAANGQWQPLADSTIERKMRDNVSNPWAPLIRSGAMEESFLGGAGAITRFAKIADADVLYMGSRVLNKYGNTYAQFHQKDQIHNQRASRHPVDITVAERELWGATISSYVVGDALEAYLAIASEA